MLVLRGGFGALFFALHGGPRLIRAYNHFVHEQPWGLLGVVDRIGLPFPMFFVLASTAVESLCSLLVGAGIATRIAAALISCNMAVALYSEASKGDSFDLPAIYLLVAVSLTILGGGRFTLPHLWQRSARS